jgi:hypothetical protein
MDPEWQEREKYCKYKAGTILKCLKTGEEPPRGNPFAPDDGVANGDEMGNEGMQSVHY